MGMKTEISTFCKEFGDVLSPFRQMLQNTVEDIQEEPESQALKHPLSGLSDVAHLLHTLVDKLEQQQAYVIIFGPLKSGKSTLMNAISSAYVSEVTSLPAYPCLVYVKHSEEKKYQYTGYNGKKEVTADGGYMQRAIRDAHQMLAERIRQIEETGEAFDPGIHFPDAIRRVDVEVPAKNLKDSLTVLVDTPGLYSKMKFGYDLMTREFRNSAACAVFVVKTDNLFLEQVFAEFNDLLDLFSRIFLVVNIDGGKRDLGPDGTLRPSLESENPDRIIRAFESLAMSAPLRRAADEGRLRIYPIDLLRSASASLQNGEESAPESDDAPKSEKANEAFSEFLTDLTDYLNSNDYLVEFMADSLRQGAGLAEEVQRCCSEESLSAFQQERAWLEDEIRRERGRQAAVERLTKINWEKAFGDVRASSRKAAEAFSDKLRGELRGALTQEVVAWFDSDDSLRDLQEARLNPLLTAKEKEIKEHASERIRSLNGSPLGGLRLEPDDLRALDRLDLKVEPIIERVSKEVLASGRAPASCALHISSEKIPVKKSIWDWLLFRGQSAVRRSLFGPTEDPERSISQGTKRKRLAEPASEALHAITDTHLKKLFPDLPGEYCDHLLSEFIREFSAAVRERIDEVKEELGTKMPDIENRLESNKRVRARLNRISELASQVRSSVDDLKDRHSSLVGAAVTSVESGGEEEPPEEEPPEGEETDRI